MVYTKGYEFPSIEELTVPEVKLGTPSLLAAANHLGKYCLTPNDEFMLCRFEEEDPRKCVTEGKAVTACSVEFFSKIKKSCLKEFEQYANCIDRSSKDLSISKCRNTQSVFDKCVLENLQIERPSHGYFCQPRVIDTKRPKPEGYVIPDFPNKPVEETPLESSRKDARYGVREFWFN